MEKVVRKKRTIREYQLPLEIRENINIIRKKQLNNSCIDLLKKIVEIFRLPLMERANTLQNFKRIYLTQYRTKLYNLINKILSSPSCIEILNVFPKWTNVWINYTQGFVQTPDRLLYEIYRQFRRNPNLNFGSGRAHGGEIIFPPEIKSIIAKKINVQYNDITDHIKNEQKIKRIKCLEIYKKLLDNLLDYTHTQTKHYKDGLSKKEFDEIYDKNDHDFFGKELYKYVEKLLQQLINNNCIDFLYNTKFKTNRFRKAYDNWVSSGSSNLVDLLWEIYKQYKSIIKSISKTKKEDYLSNLI
jgi:hypothetical protein